MIAIRPHQRASWRERADRAPSAAKKGGRNRSRADLAEAAEAAGRPGLPRRAVESPRWAAPM